MKRAWYPVAQARNLGPSDLVAFELFGEPLVCFRDRRGQPVCLQDRCPHRSTPLSEGRVVNGRLECRYHGWQFGSGGRCERIPVLAAGKTPPPGANALERPCQERHGLIWVWPDASAPEAFPEHLFEVIDAPGMGHYVYETPIDIPHDAMVENLLDPAHLPFTHHGTLSVRSAAQPIMFESIDDARALFAARVHYKRQPRVVNVLKFYAPSVVAFDVKRSATSRVRDYQLHFCVPSSRDSMRLFSLFAGNLWPGLLRISTVQRVFRWMSDRATRQDVRMLQAQRRNITRGAPHFFQPAVSDSLTLRYRKWVRSQLDEAAWFDGFDARARVLGH